MTARITLPIDRIIDEHLNQKLSVKYLAEKYGVSRAVIVQRLQGAGHTQRTRRESMIERMQQATPEQRLAWSAAAHEAVRGKPVPHKDSVSHAQGRAGKVGSPYEQRVGDALRQVGLRPLPGFPLDIFNIDIAFPKEKLAVEVDGGNWHASPKKSRQDVKKLDFLLSNGWTLSRIQVTRKTSDADILSYAHKVFSLLQSLRGDPGTVSSQQ